MVVNDVLPFPAFLSTQGKREFRAWREKRYEYNARLVIGVVISPLWVFPSYPFILIYRYILKSFRKLVILSFPLN